MLTQNKADEWLVCNNGKQIPGTFPLSKVVASKESCPNTVVQIMHCTQAGGFNWIGLDSAYTQKKQYGELLGEGCLVQGIAIVVFLVLSCGGMWIIGLLLGLVLLLIGSRLAVKTKCTTCGSVVSKEAVICHACNRTFS